jgi:hypothetical protein
MWNFHLSVHFNNTNFNYYRCIGNNYYNSLAEALFQVTVELQ